MTASSNTSPEPNARPALTLSDFLVAPVFAGLALTAWAHYSLLVASALSVTSGVASVCLSWWGFEPRGLRVRTPGARLSRKLATEISVRIFGIMTGLSFGFVLTAIASIILLFMIQIPLSGCSTAVRAGSLTGAVLCASAPFITRVVREFNSAIWLLVLAPFQN